MLTVENLSKQFGATQVLDDVSFTLEQGKVMSILGSSGSGKTTLLRCLNGLETPQKGKIIVDGTCIWQTGESMNGRMKDSPFGLVFQGFHLFPQYTALQNVMLAPSLRLKKQKLPAAQYKEQIQQLRQRASQLLERMGLSHRADSYPYQLSGGQQQRVAIARALIMKPQILCFDEPTSALDPELTREVIKVLQQLKEEKTTMIVVTHQMRLAKAISDEVAYMAYGRIWERGPVEEFFQNPKTEKLAAFLASATAHE